MNAKSNAGRRDGTGIGFVTWLRLIANARTDAARGIPRVSRDAPETGITATTPLIHRLSTRAEELARLELLRFRDDTEQQWLSREALMQDRDTSIAQLRNETPTGEESGDGGEQYRRLKRRIVTAERAIPPLNAVIDRRFQLAQLRTARHFDYTNQLIAIYWQSLRRRHRQRDRLSDQPPGLDAPQWVSSSGVPNESAGWETVLSDIGIG